MDLLARWVAYSYVYHGTVSTRQPVWICQVKNFQQYLYLFDGMTRRRGHLASQCCCCQWNSCHSTTWSLLPSLQNIFYIRKLPNNGTSISRMVINCHNRTIIAACTCLLLAFQLPGGFPTVSTGPIVKKAIFPSGYGVLTLSGTSVMPTVNAPMEYLHVTVWILIILALFGESLFQHWGHHFSCLGPLPHR